MSKQQFYLTRSFTAEGKPTSFIYPYTSAAEAIRSAETDGETAIQAEPIELGDEFTDGLIYAQAMSDDFIQNLLDVIRAVVDGDDSIQPYVEKPCAGVSEIHDKVVNAIRTANDRIVARDVRHRLES